MNRMIAMVVLVACTTVVRADSPAAPGAAETASAGVGGMAWDLVRASGAGNAIVSPVSVWEALAMTHAGGRGETAAEIAKVLGMPDDREAIATASAALRQACVAAKGKAITLDVANRIWAQKDKKLDDAFTSLLAERYGAAAGIVDFGGATEAARGEINAWVSEHTAQKIDELLQPGVLTPLTRLVLTNAVYMKAPWAAPFEKSQTRPEPFLVTPGEPVEVPFMHREATLAAGRVAAGDEAATVCEIPYAGERLAMVIIVPEKADGLAAVLGGLDGDWRTKWGGEHGPAVRRRKVVLALPKWKARKPLSLGGALESMGMKKAFDAGDADFSGIDGTRDLFVSAVVHEGFVDVGEEGTEAAAATGVVVSVRSAMPMPEEPLVVKADRPFVWAVVERGSGAILFAGVVADPRG